MEEVTKLVEIFGLGTTIAVVLLGLSWRFGNARISVWEKRENKGLDIIQTTIETLQAARNEAEERADKAERIGEMHLRSFEESNKIIADKNQLIQKLKEDSFSDVNELALEIELLQAQKRRLELDLQAANTYVGNVVKYLQGKRARLLCALKKERRKSRERKIK